MCYHAEIGHSTSKDVGINREYPQIGASWLGLRSLNRGGACLTPYKRAPLHVGYHAELDRCWSNSTRVLMENRGKIWDHCVPPFKDTQGHRYESIMVSVTSQ